MIRVRVRGLFEMEKMQVVGYQDEDNIYGAKQCINPWGWAGARVRVGVLMKVLEVLVLVLHICPEEPRNISFFFAVEVSHASQSVCLKDDALENI